MALCHHMKSEEGKENEKTEPRSYAKMGGYTILYCLMISFPKDKLRFFSFVFFCHLLFFEW